MLTYLCSFDTSSMETISLLDAEDDEHLRPETPFLDRANGEGFVGSDTPLTSTSVSSPAVISYDSCISMVTELSPDVCTPKAHVFNPFAPGPEELIFAPQKKPLQEHRVHVARRLNFDSISTSIDSLLGDTDSEESFLESTYEWILDAVVSKQLEGNLDFQLPLQLSLTDGFKTPKSLPLLTGIGDTCPGAPMKAIVRSRNCITVDFCRKLEL